MVNFTRACIIACVFLGGTLNVRISTANAAETQVQRGKYLVSVIPCTDCHTPGTFLGKPDMAKYLGGSDVGFEIPGLGVFAGRNSPNTQLLSASISTTTEPVSSTLYSTPMRAMRVTRSHLWAPTFCAVMAETAMPTANAGIWM